MSTFPRSAYDLTGGLLYFARMCDKIRLNAADNLAAEYHKNVGKGFDGRMCQYLHVDYEKLRERVLAGGTDEEALNWCYENGRKFNDMDIIVWNGFARKRGWHDDDGGTQFLAESKAASGLKDRDEIETMFDFYDVDEQRK